MIKMFKAAFSYSTANIIYKIFMLCLKTKEPDSYRAFYVTFYSALQRGQLFQILDAILFCLLLSKQTFYLE